MVFTGSDAIITIGGADYTGSIFEFEEGGGDIIYTTIKTLGNNYTQIEIGRTNYNVNISFKMLDTSLDTLFRTTTPVDIVFDVNSGFTTTYSNAKPVNYNITTEVEDMISGNITFDIPPLDDAGADNRSII